MAGRLHGTTKQKLRKRHRRNNQNGFWFIIWIKFNKNCMAVIEYLL